MTKRRFMLIAASFAFLLLAPRHPAHAAEASLIVAKEGQERRFTVPELASRPDTASIVVQNDIYDGKVTYKAVPLLTLLGPLDDSRFDTLETQSSDGFSTQIPLALIARATHGGAVAWIAVEEPARPWPKLDKQSTSAGPFYLVWQHPERSGISREQFPYALQRLTIVGKPVLRWPQLAVPSNLPADAPARRGQEVFAVQCLTCHRLDGGGDGEMGPDLARPMSPTRYFTNEGLRSLIRDPRSVRWWPGQQMPAFAKNVLSDKDLDAVVAYLQVVADTAAGSRPTSR